MLPDYVPQMRHHPSCFFFSIRGAVGLCTIGYCASTCDHISNPMAPACDHISIMHLASGRSLDHVSGV
jgi:hypothetical protein